MKQIFLRSLMIVALALSLTLPALADTVRLKDGSVIRGKIVSFTNEQFTILVGSGARLRINASGRANLGNNRTSTPDGLPSIPDRDKLMRNQPTGGLIAVIGDDNDDFIFVGRGRDFVAQRDGVLFLGVNEGNLSDNSGNFDVVIEAEASGSR